jgi:AbrB family looped-hinge helix DNA binding protein
MTTITVGRRGQIVIPKKVREVLGITAGIKLNVLVKDEKIVLKPKKGILDERGSLKGVITKTAKELIEESRKVDKKHEKRLEERYL